MSEMIREQKGKTENIGKKESGKLTEERSEKKREAKMFLEKKKKKKKKKKCHRSKSSHVSREKKKISIS